MQDKIPCQLWIAMNECGDWIVSAESDSDAAERLVEEQGGAQCRVARIEIRMRPPVDCEKNDPASIEVPDDEPATTATA